MGKPKLYDPDWVIENDEFHPDPRVAARYADQNARLASRDWLKRNIARLEALTERNTMQAAELALLREYLRATQEDIANFDKEESDEHA